MRDKSHLIIIIINTQGQIIVQVQVLTGRKLIFHFEIKSPTLQNDKVNKFKFVPALVLKWYPQGSSGSHWPSKVVRHLCSQSESGRQMHLQLWHFLFGLQEGACYRRQFVIWPHVLVIISLSVVLLGSTVIRKKTSRNFKFRSSCQSHLHCGC